MDTLPGYTLIGIDFETNGLDREGRLQVVEIAAMNFSSGNVFHSLVNPGQNVRWNRYAEATHGVSEDMVVNETVPYWKDVWDRFLKWSELEAEAQSLVLVAHNGFAFDFDIIMRKCQNRVKEKWFFLDSLSYAQYLSKKGILDSPFKLSTLRERFEIPPHGNTLIRTVSPIRTQLCD